MQKVTDIDVIAGTSIEREINETEIKQFEEDLENLKEKEEAAKAKESLRLSAFAKLGLTPEEISAIS
jgi:hypothetical protein